MKGLHPTEHLCSGSLQKVFMLSQKTELYYIISTVVSALCLTRTGNECVDRHTSILDMVTYLCYVMHF